MRRITLLFVAAALCLSASSAIAADGTAWNATGTGTGDWSIGRDRTLKDGTATLVVPADEAADDWSRPINLNGDSSNSICFDDDTDNQAESGTGTILIYWAHEKGTDLTNYIELQNASDNSIVTLTKDITCVPDTPPGWYRFKVGIVINEPGLITVRSRND